MKYIKLLLIILVPFLLIANDDRPPIAYDYLAKKEVKKFIDMMVKKHNFDRAYVTDMLRHAKLDRDTLVRYTGKYKVGSTNGSWERYKAHVLDDVSLQKAVNFKKEYYTTLSRASKLYDIDMNYIIGFMGVESKFGEYTGDYNVLDALASLAFHKNRMKRFFKSELEHLFLLSYEKRYNIRTLEGSFAGAMGCVQQVPSMGRKHRSDFNNDGITDPWDIEDCIGSIAKFMHKHKWKNGMPAAMKTSWKGGRYTKDLKPSLKKKRSLKTIQKYGIKPIQKFPESSAYLLKTRNTSHDDLYLGTSNFSVLRRYNNATTYGIAIHLIAEHVK
jgi:membrane-bound lytic murein transglycosylase B